MSCHTGGCCKAWRFVKPLYTGRAVALPAWVQEYQSYKRRPLLTDQCSELQVYSSCEIKFMSPPQTRDNTELSTFLMLLQQLLTPFVLTAREEK